MSTRVQTCFFSTIIYLAAALLLFACNPTRHLKDNEYLLNKNIINVDQRNLKAELAPIIKQKPNRRILGIFRFHLGVYNIGATGKETKFKKWLRNTVGEEPIIHDSLLTKKSVKQLKQYMQNIGYFNAAVSDSIAYHNKLANVFYFVQSNAPYIVSGYFYGISDTALKKLVIEDSANCNIIPGSNYSSNNLQKERDRITKLLRNSGYYNFSQQYIQFLVDTAFLSNRVNIRVTIDNPDMESTDTTEAALRHQKFYIHNIYVIPDYDLIYNDPLMLNRDTMAKGELLFLLLRLKKQKFKSGIIEQHVFLSRQALVRQKDIDVTYRRMQDLGVFRFVNIRMAPARPLFPADSVAGKLDAYIQLTPTLLQDYSVTNEFTTSGGNIGIAGSVSYRHKNYFRGTELFEFKVNGSVESQPDFTLQTEPEKQSQLKFNTYLIGSEINLSFHQFLLPFKTTRNEKALEPTTRLNMGFNFEQRPEYSRTISNISVGYLFRTSAKTRHWIYPAEVNFVDVTLSDAYRDKLNAINDAVLTNTYQDHMITDGRYTFEYNNQFLGRIKNILLLRFNTEFAGNSLYAADKLFNARVNDSTGNFTRLGVDYAQYVRPNFDLRYYQVFSPHTSLVYRLHTGIAVPYGNSRFILFEKSFYAGGSNDLRAFRPYSLGPGGYNDTTNIQQVGTIKLAFNFEYRFDIFKILQGAFFYDAGNVWIQKKDIKRPLADFDIKRFQKEIAMGVGVGIRLNFTFFIFRLDMAAPLKDPSQPEGHRYVLKEVNQLKDLNYNFGIGYPF